MLQAIYGYWISKVEILYNASPHEHFFPTPSLVTSRSSLKVLKVTTVKKNKMKRWSQEYLHHENWQSATYQAFFPPSGNPAVKLKHQWISVIREIHAQCGKSESKQNTGTWAWRGQVNCSATNSSKPLSSSLECVSLLTGFVFGVSVVYVQRDNPHPPWIQTSCCLSLKAKFQMAGPKCL